MGRQLIAVLLEEIAPSEIAVRIPSPLEEGQGEGWSHLVDPTHSPAFKADVFRDALGPLDQIVESRQDFAQTHDLPTP
jgi:hypothetical protein